MGWVGNHIPHNMTSKFDERMKVVDLYGRKVESLCAFMRDHHSKFLTHVKDLEESLKDIPELKYSMEKLYFDMIKEKVETDSQCYHALLRMPLKDALDKFVIESWVDQQARALQ